MHLTPYVSTANGGQRLLNVVRIVSIWTLAMGLQIFASSAVFAGPFADDCQGCHALPIDGARVNGANASAVITAANTANAMGIDLTKVAAYASDTTTLFGGASIFTGATRVVAYHSNNNSIAVPNVVVAPASNVITSYGGSATYGTVGGVGTTALTYTHTANHCGSDTVTAFGQGLATTANRFIPITITPPTITAPSPTVGLAYSTVAQNVSLGGTVNVFGVTVTSAPANGSAGVVNTNTLSYAADATTYKAQVTIGYRGEGGGYGTANTCGSSNGIATVNVGLPPPPTVSNIGTLTVSSGSPTNIDVSASLSGVVASNPPAAYAVVASQPTAGGSGSSSVSGNVITYTPPGGFAGTTTITYTKAGPGGTSNTGTITLDVSAAPFVAAASSSTSYNTPVLINLAGSITSGTAVSAVTPSAPTNGAATSTGPTTIRFTPTNGFFGSATFLYTASNIGGTSGTALVTVTVAPPAPTVAATSATVPYGTPTLIDLASSIGPGGATVLSVTPSGAVGGTVVATGPSTVTFTPTTGLVGPASFNYSATNAGGASAGTAAVSVTVSPPSAPIATSGSVSVLTNGTTAIALSTYFSGLFSSASIVTPPVNGTATLSGTNVIYTPNVGFKGGDTLAFTATGAGGTSNVATLTLTVGEIPITPSFSRAVAIDKTLTLNVSSIVTGSFSSITVTRPANGIAYVNGTVITYIPRQGFIGKDSFSYAALGGPVATSAPGTISIDVVPDQTSKVLSLTTPLNTPSSLDLKAQLIAFTFSGVIVGTAPQHGTVKVTGTTITYTPANDYFGPDSFTYIGVDSIAGNSPPGTVSVTVLPELPSVTAVTLSVAKNSVGRFDLLGYIRGTAISGISIESLPKQGIVSVAGTILTYTPRTDYFGQDVFTLIAYGVAGQSTPATVSVMVTGEPDPTKDATVTSAINSQVLAAMGMARGQVANFTRHSERSLRSRGKATGFGSGLTQPSTASWSTAPSFGGQSATNQLPITMSSLLPNATQLPQGGAPASLPLATGLSMAANDLGIASSPIYALASGLIQNQSIDLGAVQQSFAGNTSGVNPESTKVWIEGVASFGVRDASGNISGANFSSTGITVGMDRVVNEKLTVGLGVGYAQDTTNIGTDGSRSQSKGYSLAIYGSYMPGDDLFVEGLLGIGGFDFDTRRYVQPVDDFALSARKGYQYFGSIGGGYEWRGKTTMLSPYARIEFSSDRLGESSEKGASYYALTYFEQAAASMQGVLGLRGESIHATPFGFVVPRARLEWRQDLRESSEANIAYADQVGGTRYSISPSGSLRSALVWGIGSEFLFRNGWSLGLDYQLSRVSASESSFALRAKVTKELGAKGLPKLLQDVDFDLNDENDIQVDTGYTWDDNITRGRVAGDILVDNLYTLNVSKAVLVELGSNSRLLLTAATGGERFQNFNGLSKFTLTGEAAYQYRRTADFDAATWGAFAKLTGEEFQSELRDGYRYSLGVSVLQPLTDRITLSGALSVNGRRARSEVFRTMDSSARFNVDYALGRGATLYFGGEYRKGDIVSTGLASLENISIAKMLVADDAFDVGRFTSYRLDATTWLTTIGYNIGLGARDSIDLSWRRVQSTPSLRPGWATSPSSYVNNQFSVSYLMRF